MLRRGFNRSGERRGRGRYVPKRKVCTFCAEKTAIDYKTPERLARFIAVRGKIAPRRKTGTCARHQRLLAVAIKRARQLILLNYHPVPPRSHSRKRLYHQGETMAAGDAQLTAKR